MTLENFKTASNNSDELQRQQSKHPASIDDIAKGQTSVEGRARSARHDDSSPERNEPSPTTPSHMAPHSERTQALANAKSPAFPATVTKPIINVAVTPNRTRRTKRTQHSFTLAPQPPPSKRTQASRESVTRPSARSAVTNFIPQRHKHVADPL